MLTILFIYGCNNHINIEKSKLAIDTIIIDSFKIRINNKSLSQYEKYDIFYTNDIEYFIGFNYFSYSLDVFDLKNNTFVKNIRLDKKGPHGVVSVSNLFFNEDMVFILSGNFFYVLNMQGEMVKKIEIHKEIEGFNFAEFSPTRRGIHTANFDNSFLNFENRKLYIQFFPINEDEFSDKYYQKPFICEIDIKNLKAKMLEYKYPDYYLKQKFGPMNIAYFLETKDLFIYNFVNSSSIYVTNKNSKEKTCYVVNSSYIPNITPPVSKRKNSPKELNDFLFRSPKFFPLQYDHGKNVFYRIQCSELPSSEKEFYSNNRDYYLMIMGPNFKKIKELKLPEYFYPTGTISRNGLVFQRRNPGMDAGDFFLYYRLKIKYVEKTD